MTAPVMFTPYSSALEFFGKKADWVSSDDDQDRIRAYELYDKMYWTEPGTFALVKRGEDDREVQIPSSYKIVEATNQFLAKDFDFVVDTTKGSPTEQAAADEWFSNLFAREKFKAKFGAFKRNMVKRGDAIFHIKADDTKEVGKRISILEVEAAHYFPIWNEDETRLLGVHLAEKIKDPRDEDGKKYIVRRQSYYRPGEDRDPNWVTSELTYWEIDAWDDRTLKEEELKQLTDTGLESFEKVLEGIPVIPVYHCLNIRWGSWLFGISELRGLEMAIAAVNQSLSDEDLTLVTQGLGVYWTNAGPPKDAEGNEAALEIGPGVVLEVPDGNSVGRLNGVSSTAPFLEHMRFILDETNSAKGVSGAAAGKVDVSVAESGISLYLQLGPMLAKNEEKEQELLGTMDQMFYDLAQYWGPEFDEQPGLKNVIVTSVVGDPVPVNRTAVMTEVITLHDANLILTEMAIEKLSSALGYTYPPGAAEKLLEQQKSRTAAATPVDPFAEDAAKEREGNPDEPPDEG